MSRRADRKGRKSPLPGVSKPDGFEPPADWVVRTMTLVVATHSLQSVGDQPLDVCFLFLALAIHEDLCAGCVHGCKTLLDELEEWPLK